MLLVEYASLASLTCGQRCGLRCYPQECTSMWSNLQGQAAMYGRPGMSMTRAFFSSGVLPFSGGWHPGSGLIPLPSTPFCCGCRPMGDPNTCGAVGDLIHRQRSSRLRPLNRVFRAEVVMLVMLIMSLGSDESPLLEVILLMRPKRWHTHNQTSNRVQRAPR